MIKTVLGALFATRIKRSVATKMQAVQQKTKSISIMEAHRQLGHMDEYTTRKIAKELNWIITQGKWKSVVVVQLVRHSRKISSQKNQKRKQIKSMEECIWTKAD